MSVRARSLLRRSSQLVVGARRLRAGLPPSIVKVGAFLLITMLVTATGLLVWWARSPYAVKIVLGPSSSMARAIVQRWAETTNLYSRRLKLSLVDAPSTREALGQLGRGDAQLALVRIEPLMPGEVRSIAPVHRRYLVRGQRQGEDQDMELVTRTLRAVLGDRQDIPAYRLTAAEQLPSTNSAPRDVLCRAFLEERGASGQDAAALGLGVDGSDENGKELGWRDNCLSVQFHLVAMGSTDKYLILEIARELFERTRSLRGELPAMRFVRLALSNDANEVIRAHDGVALFRDRDNQTFIERNSDLIYLVVAVLSVIATALAAAYAILHRRLLDSGKKFLVRLIVLIDQTQRASTLADLDKIQRAFEKNNQGFALEIVNRSVHERTMKSFNILAEVLRERLRAERTRLKS